MRCLPKFSLFRSTIALVGVLLIAGAAVADITSLAIDLTGDLSPDRTQATISGTVQCTATESATITVHVYQPSGRLLNIGVGTGSPVTCTGGSDIWTVQATAIPGLKFKPGPTTVVVSASTASATTEVGAKVNLHP
jgi:hypothetical protein